MAGHASRCSDRYVDGRMSGRMSGRKVGWLDGRMEERKDGWVERRKGGCAATGRCVCSQSGGRVCSQWCAVKVCRRARAGPQRTLASSSSLSFIFCSFSPTRCLYSTSTRSCSRAPLRHSRPPLMERGKPSHCPAVLLRTHSTSIPPTDQIKRRKTIDSTHTRDCKSVASDEDERA
eukprot:169549-Rhodomonas_salina.1